MRQQGQKHFLCLGTRPGAENQPNWPRRRTKKIFILEKTSRLRSTNMTGTKVRRILIFDNHPASLDLLRSLDLTARRRSKLVYAVLTVVLVLAAGLGMFWPLLNP